MNPPTLSLIIPSNRTDGSLLRALESLKDQKLECFEILVVDNSNDGRLKAVVETHNITSTTPCIWLHEPRLGLHYARHAGARVARGEILVFTDDDATFEPQWLQCYADQFTARPEMVAAGGPVLPAWEVDPPQWILNHIPDKGCYGILSLIKSRDFEISTRGYFFGVNMAIRRNTLFELGGFNPESYGDLWLGNGETGLNDKIIKAGLSIGFVPGAVVRHHIPVHRMTLEYFKKRMKNEGRCQAYAFMRETPVSTTSILKEGRMAFLMWLRACIGRLVSVGGAPPVKLNAILEYARMCGYFCYIWMALLSPGIRELVRKKDWLNGD